MKRTLKIFLMILASILFVSAHADQSDSSRDPFSSRQMALSSLVVDKNGRLTLDYSNISIRNLLQLLAEYSKTNLIINDNVQGNITIYLIGVTWQQALNTLATMQHLQIQQQNNVIYVSNSNDENSNVVSTLIPIHYAHAADLATMIEKQQSQLLSEQGFISADPRTNSIWVQDTPQRLQTIRNLIHALDIPTQQVLIKAHIINIDENYLRELGVMFGTTNQSNTLQDGGMSMDMPVASNQAGQFNLAIAKLADNTLLEMQLSALESEGHGKMISNPELMTSDRMPAFIESGEEIPYQEKAGVDATNTAFKKAVLSLKVTPEITADGKIILQLTVNQDKVSSLQINGMPAIQTQEIQTQVLVNNGQTLVLGGVYEQSNTNAVERIPFLASIPGLGHLFTDRRTSSGRKELLIFVTPQIL